jgi:hypothetical protein
MCFFVNNQFRIIVDGIDVGDLEEVFETNLVRIGAVVALLDDWDTPVYLTRIWTIYEQFTALKLGIPMRMILPMDSFKSLSEEIDRGIDGIENIKKSLNKVDSEHAEAWLPEDETKVKTAIRESVGFEKVNSSVKDSMINWVGDVVTQKMRMLVFDNEAMFTEKSEHKLHKIRESEALRLTELRETSTALRAMGRDPPLG